MKMTYLIDTDLLLEALLNRANFSESARSLWQSLQEGVARGHITTTGQDRILSICAILAEAEAYDDVARGIESIASTCPVDTEVIRDARLLKLKDFESAVEVACVKAWNLDGVVTQSPENFEGAEIPVLSVEEFILLQQQNTQEEYTYTLATQDYIEAYLQTNSTQDREEAEQCVSQDERTIESKGKVPTLTSSKETEQCVSQDDQTLDSKGKVPTSKEAKALRTLVQESLESYNLTEIYDVEDIIKKTYACNDGTIDLNTFSEVHFAWFKTTCIAVLEELSRRHEHKCQFNAAIQELFDTTNPVAYSLWAGVQRMLWQYRLRGSYDVKDILIEAYSIAIKQIEEGTVIKKPFAYLRGVCFNVVRDFRRKQDQADQPKLDPTNQTLGDEVLCEITCSEDFKAIRLALQELSVEDQELLQAKYIEDKSWQQVAESLSSSRGYHLDANAARQRGHRAIQKLKKLYEEVREEVKLDDADS